MAPFSRGDSAKVVHTAAYTGPGRRASAGRRPEDFIANNMRLVAGALGIVLTIFAAGSGWMAAKMAIDSKVGEKEFTAHVVAEAAARVLIERRADRLETTVIEEFGPTLKRLDERVSAMYCSHMPPGCK